MKNSTSGFFSASQCCTGSKASKIGAQTGSSCLLRVEREADGGRVRGGDAADDGGQVGLLDSRLRWDAFSRLRGGPRDLALIQSNDSVNVGVARVPDEVRGNLKLTSFTLGLFFNACCGAGRPDMASDGVAVAACRGGRTSTVRVTGARPIRKSHRVDRASNCLAEQAVVGQVRPPKFLPVSSVPVSSPLTALPVPARTAVKFEYEWSSRLPKRVALAGQDTRRDGRSGDDREDVVAQRALARACRCRRHRSRPGRVGSRRLLPRRAQDRHQRAAAAGAVDHDALGAAAASPRRSAAGSGRPPWRRRPPPAPCRPACRRRPPAGGCACRR